MTDPTIKDTIVAIDVDNLLISSAMGGQKFKGYSLKCGFQKMFRWIETFGDISQVHFYLAKEQSNNDSLWHNLWENYKDKFHFTYTYCPKRRSEKTGKKIDNADNHLIYDVTRITSQGKDTIKYLCLASGDVDYSGLVWSLKRDLNINIAFIIGSEQSFCPVYRQMQVIGKHPLSGEELVHYFSPVKEKQTETPSVSFFIN